MDDERDVGDVEAAGGDVCCDEDRGAGGGGWGGGRGEALEGAEAGFLRELGVQREDVEGGVGGGGGEEVVEEGDQAADGGDGVCEDEGAAGVAEEEVVEVEILWGGFGVRYYVL